MAPLRFRAWDTKQSQMINHINAIYCQDGQAVEIESEYDLEVTNGQNSGVYNRKLENVVLMQSTGLHDKNGKEIFEGDVVRDNRQSIPISERNEAVTDANFIGVVRFGRHSVRSEDPFEFGRALGFYVAGLFTSALDDEYNEFASLEVIGNEFENPDLLPSQQ